MEQFSITYVIILCNPSVYILNCVLLYVLYFIFYKLSLLLSVLYVLARCTVLLYNFNGCFMYCCPVLMYLICLL